MQHLQHRSASPFVPSVRFKFRNPGLLQDGDIRLVLRDILPEIAGRVPTYRFEMHRDGEHACLGRIELRVGNTFDILQYTGHIGYHVEESFRGNHLASRSCRLLFDLARHHGMREIWITCDPDNVPSRKTCDRLGAELVSTVPVPEDHVFFKVGSRAKCRYRLTLA